MIWESSQHIPAPFHAAERFRHRRCEAVISVTLGSSASASPVGPSAATRRETGLDAMSRLWLLVASAAASKFRAAPQARHFEEGRAMVMAMLCCMAGLLTLVLAVLVVCFLLDTTLSWKHKATYYACRRKVQRVQEALMKGKEDLALCPCCVECTSTTQSQKKVKFICGHGYHLHCVNRWFHENPNSVGCPVCVGQPEELREPKECDCPRDEAQTFILHSLHRRYPAIITKECIHSWEGCNAELWLTELACPRYSSIFNKLFRPFRK
ncbi:unnamed protein product [Effrenium voratum]|nr:unnamed protein product [Effrenium voratum]